LIFLAGLQWLPGEARVLVHHAARALMEIKEDAIPVVLLPWWSANQAGSILVKTALDNKLTDGYKLPVQV